MLILVLLCVALAYLCCCMLIGVSCCLEQLLRPKCYQDDTSDTTHLMLNKPVLKVLATKGNIVQSDATTSREVHHVK